MRYVHRFTDLHRDVAFPAKACEGGTLGLGIFATGKTAAEGFPPGLQVLQQFRIQRVLITKKQCDLQRARGPQDHDLFPPDRGHGRKNTADRLREGGAVALLQPCSKLAKLLGDDFPFVQQLKDALRFPVPGSRDGLTDDNAYGFPVAQRRHDTPTQGGFRRDPTWADVRERLEGRAGEYDIDEGRSPAAHLLTVPASRGPFGMTKRT